MNLETIQSQLDKCGDQLVNLRRDLQAAITQLQNHFDKIAKDNEILSKRVDDLEQYVSGMCLTKVDLRINGVIREVMIFILNPNVPIRVQQEPPPSNPNGFSIVDPNG